MRKLVPVGHSCYKLSELNKLIIGFLCALQAASSSNPELHFNIFSHFIYIDFLTQYLLTKIYYSATN